MRENSFGVRVAGLVGKAREVITSLRKGVTYTRGSNTYAPGIREVFRRVEMVKREFANASTQPERSPSLAIEQVGYL
jgi:hypothetical protein